MFDYEKTSKAFELANFAHRHQIRKGINIPYISHPMGVASQVLVWGGNEEQFMAALLHDVLEDCGVGMAQRIEEIGGENVLRMVKECSDILPENPTQKTPWLPRKLAYLEHLKTVGDDTLLVSMADKWHNLQSILSELYRVGECVYDRFIKSEYDRQKKKEMTLWYYDSIIQVYEERKAPKAVELRRLFNEVKSFR